MGVVRDPAVLGRILPSFCHDRNHLADLQPSEHEMQVWFTRLISPASIVFLNTTKPAEEEKHVALSYTLFRKVPLGNAGLTQSWPPALEAEPLPAGKIRIEMDSRVQRETSPAEIRKHLRKAALVYVKIPHSEPLALCWNREGYQSSILKDGARDLPVLAVKSLS